MKYSLNEVSAIRARFRFAMAAALFAMVFTGMSLGQEHVPAMDGLSSKTRPAATNPSDGDTETIVFLRHGEKPPHGLGQLTPQGLNRAIALSKLLPTKFGRPDYLFAPDPAATINEGDAIYNYVRPLATIEPTAIALEMPVQTPFGLRQIDELNTELTSPKYAKATIFVAWEHILEARAAGRLMKQFGGNTADVPDWAGKDFDSLYVIKITRTAGKPATATFTHDHEGLDDQSTAMPVPASKP